MFILGFGHFLDLAEEDENEYGTAVHAEHGVGENEEEEGLEIGASHTSINPNTMMVEVVITGVTDSAMLRPR